MRPLTWLTFADAGSPMGLQTYESSVMRALNASAQGRWHFRRRIVTSLRSSQSGDIRVPMGLLERAPTPVALALGRLTTPRGQSTHRFDLRLPPPGGPEVVTVHDLPPLRFRDEGVLPRWAVASARRACAVICPSAFAAQEIRELLGVQQVVVIPNGVAGPAEGSPKMAPDERRSLGLTGRRYVLHAGGATARKNLPALAAAWRLLMPQLPDCELVLAGPQDTRRDSAFAGMERVHIIGFQPRDRTACLMAGASCVVVPSTYEGFGLPALESMALGAPVVAARRGALPEVCGDAALLCEPSAEGLAEGLLAVLDDTALCSSLVDRGRARAGLYTWERSAALHLEAYDRYL